MSGWKEFNKENKDKTKLQNLILDGLENGNAGDRLRHSNENIWFDGEKVWDSRGGNVL